MWYKRKMKKMELLENPSALDRKKVYRRTILKFWLRIPFVVVATAASICGISWYYLEEYIAILVTIFMLLFSAIGFIFPLIFMCTELSEHCK